MFGTKRYQVTRMDKARPFDAEKDTNKIAIYNKNKTAPTVYWGPTSSVHVDEKDKDGKPTGKIVKKDDVDTWVVVKKSKGKYKKLAYAYYDKELLIDKGAGKSPVKYSEDPADTAKFQKEDVRGESSK